jgi:hypothetical protein
MRSVRFAHDKGKINLFENRFIKLDIQALKATVLCLSPHALPAPDRTGEPEHIRG